jgi:hypothetical protein
MDRRYVVIANISYLGRLLVVAEDALEARAIANASIPEEWDVVAEVDLKVTSTEELDD